MQFDFTEQAAYTAPLVSPLVFHISEEVTKYTANLTEFELQNYTEPADSEFVIFHESVTSVTGPKQEKFPKFPTEFRIGVEDLYSPEVVITPRTVSTQIYHDIYYLNTVEQGLTSNNEWSWDFARIETFKQRDDIHVFQLLDHYYTPTNKFRIGAPSYYGEPLETFQSPRMGYLARELPNALGAIVGSLKNPYVGVLDQTLEGITGVLEGNRENGSNGELSLTLTVTSEFSGHVKNNLSGWIVGQLEDADRRFLGELVSHTGEFAQSIPSTNLTMEGVGYVSVFGRMRNTTLQGVNYYQYGSLQGEYRGHARGQIRSGRLADLRSNIQCKYGKLHAGSFNLHTGVRGYPNYQVYDSLRTKSLVGHFSNNHQGIFNVGITHTRVRFFGEVKKAKTLLNISTPMNVTRTPKTYRNQEL